jgi:adenylyltransferase/sulfurtransferase
MRELSYPQLLQHARHIMLPSMDIEGQERLYNSHVLIVGVGGLGCAAAQYLVASGIGSVTLMDDDAVDTSNVSRQVLYRSADVARSKVDCARDQLYQLNPDCEIMASPSRFDIDTPVNLYDCVLDCSDNKATRLLVDRACAAAGVPSVVGAAVRMEGQLGVFHTLGSRTAYHDVARLFGEPNVSCSEAGVLSPVVGIIGSMQAAEALKLLSGCAPTLCDQWLLLDVATMQMQTFAIPHIT